MTYPIGFIVALILLILSFVQWVIKSPRLPDSLLFAVWAIAVFVILGRLG